jgi:hypothetical protein
VSHCLGVCVLQQAHIKQAEYHYSNIYIQQDATLHCLFYCPACFRWYPHPSSGAPNNRCCRYSC